MWELSYEIQQLRKCIPVYLHRYMFIVKYNAVLVVVNVRRVLQIVHLTAESDRNDAVILSCGMGDMTCIALVLFAEKTCGITGFLSLSGSGNISRILFRL